MLLGCESSSTNSCCQKQYLLLNTLPVRISLFYDLIRGKKKKISNALVQFERLYFMYARKLY